MKIIIFGAGDMGKKLLRFQPKETVEILFVCDNSAAAWGTSINGYPIVPPEKIKDAAFDLILLAIINGEALNEILMQLIGMGVPEEKIKYTYSVDMVEFMDSDLDDFFVIEKKPYVVPFKKGPAEIYNDYKGETYHCHDRREREGFFEKYCQGEGLDIGYGADLIVPGCSGWDMQNGDAQYIREVEDESFDFVYSSHCLEHMRDVRVALQNWFRAVKRGGFLIIAVPHRDLYEKKSCLPSRWNGDHKHMFLIGKSEYPDTLDIVEEIRESLTGYDIKYVKACDEGHTITNPMIHSDGEYQIEIVIQKQG